MAHPLREYRAKHGLSQQALADKLGYSRISIIRWEGGRRNPRPQELETITEKTGISARKLRPDLAKILEGR